ncbi:hypothetical protein GCM10027586_12090 [Kineococcus gypseus]|uniref:hypothetical protein n=1 Tax=Kineococcus gypseus TaxID=1637102 RepID=UPI003D7C9B48
MTERATEPVDLEGRSQGDLLPDLTTFPVTGPDGQVQHLTAPHGVVLTSQTCDIVLEKVTHLQVAPLVHLEEKDARGARAGDRPRYAHLPELGSTAFADLELISTVHKAVVAPLAHCPGVQQDADVRRLGQEIGRRFSRFAFPDAVVAWLRPLEKEMRSKAPKETSPLGQVLADVLELRVEATGGWGEPPYDLVLVVVVAPGALPMLPDDDAPCPPDLRSAALPEPGATLPAPAQAAATLIAAEDPVRRYWAWTAFGNALVARCGPSEREQSARSAVSSLLPEVVSADDYPLSRVRRSERLDLDLLSAPYPA